jgi:carbonic anhydrase/acetyltransferase-like protein (isoleucine patch superfamily)
MIRAFASTSPQIADSCYIDPNADVIGDVVIGDNSSIWPMAVVRGDVNFIRIGQNTNIQDGSVLHVSHAGVFNEQGAALIIGDNVTVGHNCVLHACTIWNDCLVGMGSILMDNAVVENHVMIGAGSLVPPGKTLDSGYLYLGNPCKRVRKLKEHELEYLGYSAQHYVRLKNQYLQQTKSD